MTTRRTRIAIADDHPVVLQGLTALLTGERDCEVVASCRRGTDCLEALRQLRPDVAVVDLAMPDVDGLQIIAAAAKDRLPTRIVLLSAAPSQAEIAAAIERGVHGIVLKDAATETLVRAVRTVAAGKQWLPRDVVQAAFEQKQVEATAASLMRILSEREREVVALVARGLGNKKVGKQLKISEGTVKLHLHSVYRKLGVENRTALARLFLGARG